MTAHPVMQAGVMLGWAGVALLILGGLLVLLYQDWPSGQKSPLSFKVGIGLLVLAVLTELTGFVLVIVGGA